jgi:hypothetical protein
MDRTTLSKLISQYKLILSLFITPGSLAGNLVGRHSVPYVWVYETWWIVILAKLRKAVPLTVNLREIR